MCVCVCLCACVLQQYDNDEDFFFRTIHLGTECWMYIANNRTRSAAEFANRGDWHIASARIMQVMDHEAWDSAVLLGQCYIYMPCRHGCIRQGAQSNCCIEHDSLDLAGVPCPPLLHAAALY